MRRVRWGLVVLALSVSAALPAGAAAASETEAAIAAINKARASVGVAPVKLSPTLTRSSGAFGRRLMRIDVFAHAPTIQAAGSFRRLGECLAMHTGRAARPGWTVRRWLASPGHRPLVLSSGFRHAGAAAVRGRFHGRPSTIWVLQLGGR
jgi:uncharacterized protein YkwD